ncbi:MAG: undecaprenyl-phosphate glucose phosphotransferase, partial [Notoacmeibacter sp.]
MTKHEAPATLTATASPAEIALDNKEHLRALAQDIAKQFSHETISPAMVTGILRMVDTALIALAGVFCYFAYVGHGPLMIFYYTISIVGGLIGMFLLEVNGAYQMKILRTPLSSLGKIFTVLGGSFAAIAIIGFFLKMSEDFSRLWFGIWFLTATGAVALGRIALTLLIRRWARNGIMERRAVVIGGGTSAEELIR